MWKRLASRRDGTTNLHTVAWLRFVDQIIIHDNIDRPRQLPKRRALRHFLQCECLHEAQVIPTQQQRSARVGTTSEAASMQRQTYLMIIVHTKAKFSFKRVSCSIFCGIRTACWQARHVRRVTVLALQERALQSTPIAPIDSFSTNTSGLLHALLWGSNERSLRPSGVRASTW